MLGKLLSVLRQFKRYKLSDVERDLFKEIKQFWESEEDRSGRRQNTHTAIRVIVEGFVECPASIMDKARMAKAVQEVTGEEAIVLVRGMKESASRVIPFYRAFGINHFVLWWRNYLNPFVVIPAAWLAFKLIRSVRSGEKLVEYRFKGIHVGDLMYDTLIRFRPNSYTVDKLEFRKHYRLLLRAFYIFIINERVIKKYQPNWLITSHNVYAEFGLLARQMNNRVNASILLKDIDVYKFYGPETKIKEHFLKVKESDLERVINDDDFYEEALKYLEERFSGKVDQIDVINAYRDKKEYSFEDLKKLYPDLNSSYKNVFVMSHAFSDAPHVGEGLLFKDYYQFLLETLICLNSVSNINCFVKPHPSSYMWGERGGVEQIVEEYSLNNVRILPSDLNTNCIKELADCVVTGQGTAGLEFSCFGIPAITAGKGYYSGFGIALEPRLKEEYFELLENASHLPPLNTLAKKKAVCMLYYISKNKYHSDVLPKKHIFPGDDLGSVYINRISEIKGSLDTGCLIRDVFYSRVVDDILSLANKR
ncbi:hypothetical protein C9974_00495 [Marinobacter sp. B9-2]|nr:hypothetical protein C9974_00495 [Marinobacter sp. B9-2]